MKHTAWLMLIAAAVLPGCSANEFTPTAPMHVPHIFYQPAYYSVGKGLNAQMVAGKAARRRVRLSKLLAAVKMPAIPPVHQVSKKQQQKALVLYGLGLNAMYGHRYSGARYLLSQSIKLNPYSVKALIAMGEVSARLGETVAADRYWRSAYQLDPQNPRLQMYAAQRESHDKATELQHWLMARKSPQLKPDSPLLPRIDLSLGAALQANGYYRAAESVYRQAAILLLAPAVAYQFNPLDQRLIKSRGFVEFLVGRNALLAGWPQAAVAAFSVARKDGFTNPLIDGQMALALQLAGHPKSAARYGMEYCVRTDDSTASIIVLSELELDAHGAADITAAASAYHVGSIAAYRAMAAAGKAAWNTGHFETARQIFAQLLRQQPARDHVVASYVVLSICTGHRLTAIQAVTRQMAIKPLPSKAWDALVADIFGLHPSPTAVRRLLVKVQHRKLLSADINPRQQVEQLEWQYALVDDVALLTGRRTFSLATTTQVLHAAPRFWPAIKAQCLALAYAHQFKTADKLIQKAIAAHLGGAGAGVVQAQLYAAADRLAAALATVADAIDQDPHDKLLWHEAVHLANQQQDFPREIALLRRESELFPHSRRLAFRLVQEEYTFGDLPAFRRKVQAYLSRFPGGKRHLIVVAMLESANNNWPGVLQAITMAGRDYPTSRLAAVWLAAISDSMGHTHTGAGILRNALKYHPANALLINQYAQLCYRMGAPGAAWVYARQMAARYPQSAGVRQAYLDVLTHNHLWMQARRLVARWQHQNPHSNEVLRAHWQIDFRSHHYRAALVVARRLVDRPIPRFFDLTRLANTYWQLHNKPAVMRVYRRILAIAPQYAYANNNLGFEMVQQNLHLHRALAHIALALHNYPDTAQYLDSYGWALYKLGFAARAVPYLQRAVVLTGLRHPTVFRHLGDALAKIGDWHGALFVWKAGVKAIGTHMPLTKREKRLLERLNRRIKAETIRESLRQLKGGQAM